MSIHEPTVEEDLTEEEFRRLLASNKDLWAIAFRRGKALWRGGGLCLTRTRRR